MAFPVRRSRSTVPRRVRRRRFPPAVGRGAFQKRALRESRILSTQLQHALTSRIHIEQAKGFLVHQADISLDDAFRLLRGYSRRTSRRLVEVAHDVVTKQLPVTDLTRYDPDDD
ncbi:ANTAR domain-containing protein [Amycolatopsis azurea]|uniref:ANTAR domain-containing protein n=1 Tax=Amycolatopsis azurea TaxID=36819 RepID=UPI0012FB39C6|nr:ANTAR domain-containing protein [Amycolatopsis azurea]